jgi:hypothetical protein
MISRVYQGEIRQLDTPLLALRNEGKIVADRPTSEILNAEGLLGKHGLEKW